jgi:L-malate glycosyltransferase
VSPSSLQHFVAAFNRYISPSTSLCVIPNSVDIARFHPSPARRARARAALQLPLDSLVLGSVARLSPQKRPDTLLDLFCALRKRHSSLYLVLLGSGPLERELRAQAERAGVSPFVRFGGFVSAVEEVMPAFDLHLLMSRNEGFGIATVEAMACGVPAVGTDVPGTADILRDSRGGLLLAPDDLDGAADLVSGLLDRPELRRAMARHARAEAESKYSSTLMERRLIDFYAGLA